MIVDRVMQIIEYKCINKNKFYIETGLSNGFLDKVKDIGGSKIEQILNSYPEINSEWLLTGKGSMLKSEDNLNINVEKNIKRNLIPLYNDVATIGGVNCLEANTDAVSYTTEYIDAGDWFPKATAAIRHYGDSMVEYPSGSILVLKKLEDVRLLVWGRNYCIETTEYRITKRLNKSKKEEHLTGYSSNREIYPDGCLIHEPVDIPTETIQSIHQVLGCVIKEYSNGLVEMTKK